MKANSKIRVIAQACSLIYVGSFTQMATASPNSDSFLALGSAESKSPALNKIESAALYDEAVMRAAEQNLSVVYLGSERLASQIGKGLTITQALNKAGSRQIVIADSNYQDKDLLMQLLANGNYVISIGNTKIDTTQSAFDMLQDIEDKGKLSKRAADYDVNQPRFRVTTGGDDGVESTIEGTLSAYFFSPRGSKAFYTANQDMTAAVAEALVWARDTALTEELRALVPTSKALGFTEKLQRNSTYDCPHPQPGNTTAIGRLNVKTIYSKADNDGNTTKDYWEVRYVGQMLPSQVINNGSGWGWKNEDLWVIGKANRTAPTGLLKDYGPTTTQGVSTASVDLSLNAGSGGVGGGISRSWGYTTSDIVVRDYSDFSKQDVQWWHDIAGSKPVGSTSVKLEPGALVELPQGTLAHTSMYEYYKAQWMVLGSGSAAYSKKWCSLAWN